MVETLSNTQVQSEPFNESAKRMKDNSPGWSAKRGTLGSPAREFQRARFSGRKILSPAKAGFGIVMTTLPRVSFAALTTPWAIFFRPLCGLIEMLLAHGLNIHPPERQDSIPFNQLQKTSNQILINLNRLQKLTLRHPLMLCMRIQNRTRPDE